jgi:microcystin-dependent protein
MAKKLMSYDVKPAASPRNQIAPQAFKNIGGTNIFLNITGDLAMNSIIYLIGLVVVIMAILSFLGLR